MTHDVAEDVDIYSDLSTVNYSDNLKQLESSNRDLLLQVKALKQELSKTVKEKDQLQARCQALSFNISSLFKTAQLEIERKNKTISELRSEINDVLFRRNKGGKNNWSDRREQDKPDDSSSLEPKGRRNKYNESTESKYNESVREMEVKKFPASKNDHKVGSKDSKNGEKRLRDNTNSSYNNHRRRESRTEKISDDPLRNKDNIIPDSKKLSSERTSKNIKEKSSLSGSCNNSLDKNIYSQCITNNSKSGEIDFDVNNKNKFRVGDSLSQSALTNNGDSSINDSPVSCYGKKNNKISEPPIMTEYSRRMLKRLQSIPSKNEEIKNSDLNSVISGDKKCTDNLILPKESSKLAEISTKEVIGSNISVEMSCVDNSKLILPNLLPNETKTFKKCTSLSENQTNNVFNVSVDLSISSSSSSDIGELNISQTCSTSKSEELLNKEINLFKPVESTNVNKSDSDKIRPSPKTDLAVIIPNNVSIQGNMDLHKSNTVNSNLFQITEVEEKVINQDKMIIPNENSIINEQRNKKFSKKPCIDSVISNSNSLHDMLNVSGDKNNSINVSYELFSLESIDKFAISPKKDSCSDNIFNKFVSNDNIKGLNSDLNGQKCKNEMEQVKSVENNLNNSVINDNKIISNTNKHNETNPNDSLISKCTYDLLENRLDLHKDKTVHTTSEKDGFCQDIISVHEEAVVSVNNKTVETFTSDNILICNKMSKNNFKPIITPISNLWAKSYSMKNSENHLSLATFEKKKICDINLQNPSVFESKSDIVQSIFGSPVKWADSDSIDFIPPTKDHEPLIFEDSRSCSNGLKSNDNLILGDTDKNDKVLKNGGEGGNKLFSSEPQKSEEGSVKILTSVGEVSSNSVSLVCDKNMSSVGLKCKYEDTTLGQFEDTLQFISALSSLKESVSPIGTPEKVDNTSLSDKTPPPFSSVKINQKAGFKIVGPNEKPINILTPRRKPRIVSPQKVSSSGTSPNSVDSKNCRISCIDDKAIESVCNLVSSIKETNHRETYLVIPKKSKTKTSPKKISDANDRSLNLDKSSPIKSPKKSPKLSPNQKKNAKTYVKTVPSVKLSPKKKAFIKLNNSLKSKDNNLKALKNNSINSEVNSDANVDRETRGIKLIESLPLIPKLDNCTKVKMSYELKKPSRMNRKNEINNKQIKLNDREVSNNSGTYNEGDTLEKKEQGENSPREHSDCLSGGEKQIQGNELITKSLDHCTSSPVSYDKIPDDSKYNESEGQNAQCDNYDIPTDVQIEGNVNIDILEKCNLSKDEKADGLISGSSDGKTSSKLLEKTCENNSKSKSSSVKDINHSKYGVDKSEKNGNSTSYELSNGKPSFKRERKRSYERMSHANESKSRNKEHSESKSDSKSKTGSHKSSKSRYSTSPSYSSEYKRVSTNSTRNYSEGLKSKKRRRTGLEDLVIIKSRRRSRSSSPDLHYSRSKHRHSDKYRSHFKRSHNKVGSRNSLELNNDHYCLSYREKLSRRYSCYRRREPSVFSKLGKSPERDFSSKNNEKQIKSRKNLVGEKSRLSSEKKMIHNGSLIRSHYSQSSKDRSWGSSPVFVVSVSSKLEDNNAPNQSNYDRINGISCNNIKWKLIRIEDNITASSPSLESSEEKVTLSQLLATTNISSLSSSIVSPKIISEKKSLKFSSSDINTDYFSSTPKKSNVSQDKIVVNESISLTSPSNSDHFQISNKSEELPVRKTRSRVKERQSLVKASDNSVEINENKDLNTVTYRIPSFLKKSKDEVMKTVEVSEIKNKFCGVFSSPPSNQNQDHTFSDELDVSISSFTSDESWAPKKKRKKK